MNIVLLFFIIIIIIILSINVYSIIYFKWLNDYMISLEKSCNKFTPELYTYRYNLINNNKINIYQNLFISTSYLIIILFIILYLIVFYKNNYIINKNNLIFIIVIILYILSFYKIDNIFKNISTILDKYSKIYKSLNSIIKIKLNNEPIILKNTIEQNTNYNKDIFTNYILNINILVISYTDRTKTLSIHNLDFSDNKNYLILIVNENEELGVLKKSYILFNINKDNYNIISPTTNNYLNFKNCIQIHDSVGLGTSNYSSVDIIYNANFIDINAPTNKTRKTYIYILNNNTNNNNFPYYYLYYNNVNNIIYFTDKNNKLFNYKLNNLLSQPPSSSFATPILNDINNEIINTIIISPNDNNFFILNNSNNIKVNNTDIPYPSLTSWNYDITDKNIDTNLSSFTTISLTVQNNILKGYYTISKNNSSYYMILLSSQKIDTAKISININNNNYKINNYFQYKPSATPYYYYIINITDNNEYNKFEITINNSIALKILFTFSSLNPISDNINLNNIIINTSNKSKYFRVYNKNIIFTGIFSDMVKLKRHKYYFDDKKEEVINIDSNLISTNEKIDSNIFKNELMPYLINKYDNIGNPIDIANKYDMVYKNNDFVKYFTLNKYYKNFLDNYNSIENIYKYELSIFEDFLNMNKFTINLKNNNIISSSELNNIKFDKYADLHNFNNSNYKYIFDNDNNIKLEAIYDIIENNNVIYNNSGKYDNNATNIIQSIYNYIMKNDSNISLKTLYDDYDYLLLNNNINTTLQKEYYNKQYIIYIILLLYIIIYLIFLHCLFMIFSDNYKLSLVIILLIIIILVVYNNKFSKI